MDSRPELSPAFMDALCRRDFVAFLARVFELVSPADEFVPNWHLYAIAWELKLIEQGKSKRLLTTMPPRNLKTIAISVAWVAWLLGHDPKKQIVCVATRRLRETMPGIVAP